MRTKNEFGTVLCLIGALTLGACTNMPPSSHAYDSSASNSGYAISGYGVVQSVDLVRQNYNGSTGSGIGVGTIAGAVVGGVVGSQVGSGSGNTAATVIGAAGGAYIGHELENRQQRTADAYKITVRMEDRSYRSFIVSTNTNFRVGDQVRVDNGNLMRY